MVSPSFTSARGPPSADSGETCSTTVPKAVPLIRASLMRTMSEMPAFNNLAGIGISPHSGIPGAPLGPAVFIHIELWIIHTHHHLIVVLEDYGTALVLLKVRRSCGLFDHRSVRGEVPIQNHCAALRMKRLIERFDNFPVEAFGLRNVLTHRLSGYGQRVEAQQRA